MKKINIGQSGLVGTEAVFGTWALGGDYWGPQNHSDSVKAIQAAARAGINHFDTAPVYGKGRAEMLLGQQLRKNRGDYIIADKCFYKEPDVFAKSFETSLRRLNTDYIDIFYIHWPASGADMRPVMELLEQYRREGKIRAVGVSNFSVNQIREIMEAGTVDIAQFGYNLIWRREEEELIPFCRARGITTAAYSILAQGILTGKFTRYPEGEEYKWRRKLVLFDRDVFPEIQKEMNNLREIAVKNDLSPAQASILWTKENELIDCSILGCRNRSQTEENLKPFSITMDSRLTEELNDLSDRIRPMVPLEENIFRHKT
ncbi:MAG: aldo/keto reductase [Spirochaetales bacterium]|nr:aldo/keto reductase [Spirochaetales bacterium]